MRRCSTTDDDLMLLSRWRAGERVAGNALIRRHYGFAYRLGLERLGGDADAAREVAQRAFETLLRKRDEIETSFKGYLRRVVILKVLSLRRARTAEGGASGLVAPSCGMESAVARREETARLVKALRSLSLEDQLLLAWAYGDEKTQREIAESLDLGLAQCNTRLHRARQRLRRQLGQLGRVPTHETRLGGFESWMASVHGRLREEVAGPAAPPTEP